jgi:hypothetical protein
MKFREVRRLILDRLQDYLTEIDLDGVPDRHKVPQNQLLVFPKPFAGQVACHQDLTRQGRPMECYVTFDEDDPSPVREGLCSRLKELGFKIVESD